MHLPLKSGRLDFGHQKLVRKRRKGSVQLSEHLAEYKGEALRVRRSGSGGGWWCVCVWGTQWRYGEAPLGKARGSEWGSSTGGPAALSLLEAS